MLVGDRCCGKTALAVRLSSDLFLDYYLPTQLVDDFTAEVDTGKYSYKLTLLDLSGSCENDGIRSLVYENCDVVVVCFDLTDPSSLESVTSIWLPELEHKCPGIPYILAGCKQDETCDEDHADGCHSCSQSVLTRDVMKGLLLNTRARSYIECSSKYMDGMEELTRLVVEAAQKRKTAARKFASSIKNSRLLRKLSLF